MLAITEELVLGRLRRFKVPLTFTVPSQGSVGQMKGMSKKSVRLRTRFRAISVRLFSIQRASS